MNRPCRRRAATRRLRFIPVGAFSPVAVFYLLVIVG
jgi:hypothetical protein